MSEAKQRIIQEFVPGKQTTMAHLIANPKEDLYTKLGVITKNDLIKDERQLRAAEKSLTLAGARPIFRICSMTGEGIKELIDYLTEDF